VVLCWGWIDGLRKAFGDKSYLQRYTPRTRNSIWSQINVDSVARLIDEGRMTEHGLARGSRPPRPTGRWDRALPKQGHENPGPICRPPLTLSRRPGACSRSSAPQNRFRACLPHPEHEDREWSTKEDRDLRRPC